jgi:CubicO group peptidase (beta-lactamase class C family)
MNRLLLSFLILNFFFHLHSQNTIDSAFLEQKIDSIIYLGLDSLAYPGAQVLISLKGETVFHKTYGFHTFENEQEVHKDDLYDFASITKVTTGLPILMKLYGEGRFDLDAPLKSYLPKFKGSNKGNLTFREMLAHQAQLKPYIVFWQKALKKNGRFKRRTFNERPSKKYSIPITNDLFLHEKYRKRMVKTIKKSSLELEKEYKYSGLLFLLLPEIIENITGEDFVAYLSKNIYETIGASTLTYNPLTKFPIDRIIPTELDTFFRKQLIHGTVHDEAAAMLGGISCNAGLFGSAKDLDKLFQLYLNEGYWQGKSVIASKAIQEFTKCQFCETENRRGLGFDKPMIEYETGKGYVAKSASSQSFGHSGFTGTFVWADPKEDLIVIFLSNRVYPTRENRKLYSMNIRPMLHQVIYDSLN